MNKVDADQSSIDEIKQDLQKEQSPKARLKQLRVNWLLTFLLGVHMAVCFILYLPTLHNFVVNPANDTCENPGLGGSELEYSIVVSMTSIGSFFGAIFALSIARNLLSYKITMILVPSISAIAFSIYGLSVTSWMVMIARFIAGFARGLTVILFTWYYVSSSEEYNILQKKLGKPTSTGLKRTLTVIFAVITTSSYIPLSGMVALVAQFADLDQFRWPAWFNIGFSLCTAALMVLFFRDGNIPSSCKYSSSSCAVDETIKPPRTRKFSIKGFKIRDIIIIVILAYTGSIIDSSFRILETITSPLLSDYFGFDVTRITYFTFGLTSLFPLSCFCLLFLERIKVSSRFVLLLAVLSNTCGLTLMSNWQSLGGSPDVCANYSTEYEITVKNECVGSSGIGKECSEVSLNVRSCLNDTAIFYYRNLDDIFNSTATNDCLPCEESDNDCYSFQLSGSQLCLAKEPSGPQLCLYSYGNGEFYNPEQNITCNTSIYDELVIEASDIIDSKSTSSPEQAQCEANDMCYWNPQSIITGDYCDDCPQLCRNKKKSLNFIQVCFAVLLTTISVEMTRFTALPMMSKSVSSNLKLIATCLYVLSGSISRLLTPLWFNTLYVATNRQTVTPCSVFLVLQIPVYIGFIYLCATRHREKNNNDGSSENGSSETSSNASEDDRAFKQMPVATNPMFDTKPMLDIKKFDTKTLSGKDECVVVGSNVKDVNNIEFTTIEHTKL